MKILGFALFMFLITESGGIKASESQGLLLRAYIPAVFKVALSERKIKKESVEFSFVTESNTVKLEENHKIEIDNPTGLEINFEQISTDDGAKKEYRFVVKNNQQLLVKNPVVTLKVSAN